MLLLTDAEFKESPVVSDTEAAERPTEQTALLQMISLKAWMC